MLMDACPLTFMSSRLAGRMPGLRLDRLLLGRAGAGAGRDTIIEVGRLLAPLV